MRFVLSILLLAVAAASASIITGDNAMAELKLRSQFGSFKSNFAKFYESAEVEESRFAIFKENMFHAAELNRVMPSAEFGETRFADLTNKEFKQFFKGYKHGADRDLAVRQPSLSAPSEIDWVKAGYTTAVKDQGQCGSCWAFSAVQGLESAWAAARNLTGNDGKNIPVLAPEQVVDCDKTDAGCNGGDLPPAFSYMQKNGLTLEQLYPYTAGQSGRATTCKTNITVVATMSGFTYATPACKSSNSQCTGMDENVLAANLAQVGPSAICVNAEGTNSNPYVWQMYSRGVITGYNTCPGGWNDLDHCVLLTGYGTDAATNVPYWNVKNSWGSSWGESGYIRLQRGVNMCGVADEATFVTI